MSSLKKKLSQTNPRRISESLNISDLPIKTIFEKDGWAYCSPNYGRKIDCPHDHMKHDCSMNVGSVGIDRYNDYNTFYCSSCDARMSKNTLDYFRKRLIMMYGPQVMRLISPLLP